MKQILGQSFATKTKKLSKIALLNLASFCIISAVNAQTKDINYATVQDKKQQTEAHRKIAILQRENWLAKQNELQQKLDDKANGSKTLWGKKNKINEEVKITLEKQRKIAEINRQKAKKIKDEQLLFRENIRKEHKILFDNAKELRTETLAKGNLRLQKLEAQKEALEKAKLFREKSLAELKENRAQRHNAL